MQAAMSASRAPTVQESNGRYAVPIAPGVVLRWWFELRDGRIQCFVKVDLPDMLKSYPDRCRRQTRPDLVPAGALMSAITIVLASLSALALAILILAAIDDRKRQQRLGSMKLGAMSRESFVNRKECETSPWG